MEIQEAMMVSSDDPLLNEVAEVYQVYNNKMRTWPNKLALVVASSRFIRKARSRARRAKAVESRSFHQPLQSWQWKERGRAMDRPKEPSAWAIRDSPDEAATTWTRALER